MSGKPVKLLEKGALAKGQKVGVSPSSGFLLVRFVNRIAEYVSSAKLSLAGDLKGLKFAMT
ncbi:hypothetical protein [Lactococcus lactis]|uniref:hypothetical protein n=1 Tax=Lactococcus lactis TaxID=1358 RepID=UPI00147979EF|nr:hypothetical protein [Lactococcus lactis]